MIRMSERLRLGSSFYHSREAERRGKFVLRNPYELAPGLLSENEPLTYIVDLVSCISLCIKL